MNQWCVVELLGHVRMSGFLTEEEHFGTKLGRLDVPGPGGRTSTHYFGGGSVYRITPTTEEIARSVTRSAPLESVHRYELPKPKDAARSFQNDDDDDPGIEDDDVREFLNINLEDIELDDDDLNEDGIEDDDEIDFEEDDDEIDFERDLLR